MKKLIYVVDDEPLQLHYLQASLRMLDFNVEAFSSAEDVLRALDQRVPHVLVIDLILPEMSGTELIAEIRRRAHRVPIVAVTAYPEIETALTAVRSGANDYLKKPFETAELQLVVERLIDSMSVEDNLVSRLERDASRFSLDGMLGSSPSMQVTRTSLRRAAEDETGTTLLTGEAGSGKSFAARVLHYARPDLRARLVEVQCGALTDEEQSAELFGTPGSGAQRVPAFDLADGGTLLVDDINHMGPQTQKRFVDLLSRKLSDARNVSRCRVIALSSTDLSGLVSAGRFDAELYALLTPGSIRIPPLRERGTDVLELAAHFLAHSESTRASKITGFSDAAGHDLLAYSWPGNVRELKAVVDRAIVTASSPQIGAADLHLGTAADDQRAAEADLSSAVSTLRELEIKQIKRVLQFTNGDITQAAAILGISRKSLWERRKRYQID